MRKHGGRQEYGWSFDFAYLHAKSGSLSPLKHFAYDLRDIVRRQPLPGYSLAIERAASGAERLAFKPSSIDPLAQAPASLPSARPALGITCEFPRAIRDRSSRAIGDPIPVLSGTEIGGNTMAFNSLRTPVTSLT